MASESLKVILEKVNSGKIVLPEFQRDFVWSQSSVIKLMTSIFNGYPIGSLLLMENNGSYSFREIDGSPKIIGLDKDKLDLDLILDGQQRVTSCYRAFYGTLDDQSKNPGRYYFNYKKYVDLIISGEDPEGSVIEDLFEFFKPERIRIRLGTMSAEISEGLIPLDIFLKSRDDYNYAEWLGQYNFSEAKGDSSLYKILSAISSKFQIKFIESVTGYQVNFEKITRDTNADVICTIFETINTTGVKLTVFDLLVAKCFKSNVNLRDLLDDALSSRRWINKFDPSGKNIAIVQLPRILGQIIKKECKKGVVLGLDAKDIEANWFRSVEGLEKALELIHNEFGVINSEWIPSSDIIAPLAVILTDSKYKKDIHIKGLSKWYWRSIFGQYFRGAPETKISKAVREILAPDGMFGTAEFEPESIKNYALNVSHLESATKNTTFYKGLMTLMMSKNPVDIGVDQVLLKMIDSSKVHDHHIYPQKFLHNNGIKGEKANQILNKMPIYKETNEKIGSIAPNIYIHDSSLCGVDVLSNLSDCYFVDSEIVKKVFSPSVYLEFLESRKMNFIKLINEATEFFDE